MWGETDKGYRVLLGKGGVRCYLEHIEVRGRILVK